MQPKRKHKSKTTISDKMNKSISLLLFGAMTIAACSDDTVLSAVDEKPWTLDGNKDISVSPGDDFFMYCNGAWYNATETDWEAGFLTDISYKNDMRKEELRENDPDIRQVKENVMNIDQTTEAGLAALSEAVRMTDGISTHEDVWRAAAKLYVEGYYTLFDIYLGNVDGLMKAYIYPSVSIKSARSGNTAFAAKRLLHSRTHSVNDIKKSHTLLENAHPLTATRSVESGQILDVVAEGLGLDKDDVYLDADMEDFINQLSDIDPVRLKAFMADIIEADTVYTSTRALDEYERLEDLARDIQEYWMGYYFSRAYTREYLTPEIKENMTRCCQEILSTAKDRLGKNQWLSSTTRQNAIDKLDNMGIHAVYPDEWYEEGLPTIEPGPVVVNIHQLYKAYNLTGLYLVGKRVQDVAMDYAASSYDSNLTVANAFYMPDMNSIVILPAFAIEPFYSPNQSDALNYAMLMPVGHEITHAFDDLGANYDMNGCYRNWWTVNDKMTFEEKQQSLVNCYNMLEIMPDEMPGVYTNGEKTLGENIADLGGFNIAYDAYMNKLRAEGFSGEEMVKQEKKFFQGYAELWRTKSTVEASLYQYENDVHAQGKERVNGVVMNFDRWYELFDVKQENKLWLPVEKRTYIW